MRFFPFLFTFLLLLLVSTPARTPATNVYDATTQVIKARIKTAQISHVRNRWMGPTFVGGPPPQRGIVILSAVAPQDTECKTTTALAPKHKKTTRKASTFSKIYRPVRNLGHLLEDYRFLAASEDVRLQEISGSLLMSLLGNAILLCVSAMSVATLFGFLVHRSCPPRLYSWVTFPRDWNRRRRRRERQDIISNIEDDVVDYFRKLAVSFSLYVWWVFTVPDRVSNRCNQAIQRLLVYSDEVVLFPIDELWSSSEDVRSSYLQSLMRLATNPAPTTLAHPPFYYLKFPTADELIAQVMFFWVRCIMVAVYSLDTIRTTEFLGSSTTTSTLAHPPCYYWMMFREKRLIQQALDLLWWCCIIAVRPVGRYELVPGLLFCLPSILLQEMKAPVTTLARPSGYYFCKAFQRRYFFWWYKLVSGCSVSKQLTALLVPSRLPSKPLRNGTKATMTITHKLVPGLSNTFTSLLLPSSLSEPVVSTRATTTTIAHKLGPALSNKLALLLVPKPVAKDTMATTTTIAYKLAPGLHSKLTPLLVPKPVVAKETKATTTTIAYKLAPGLYSKLTPLLVPKPVTKETKVATTTIAYKLAPGLSNKLTPLLVPKPVAKDAKVATMTIAYKLAPGLSNKLTPLLVPVAREMKSTTTTTITHKLAPGLSLPKLKFSLLRSESPSPVVDEIIAATTALARPSGCFNITDPKTLTPAVESGSDGTPNISSTEPDSCSTPVAILFAEPDSDSVPALVPAAEPTSSSSSPGEDSTQSSNSYAETAQLDINATLVPLGYKVRKMLQEGSYGCVYAMEDSEGECCAVKWIDDIHGTMASHESNILQKFKCNEKLGNGIVQYRRTVKGQFGTFIVMELCPGMDLFEHVITFRYYNIKLRDVTFAVLRALRTMHEQGMVHTDIKPENIMYDKSNGPVIIDLGLCLQLPNSGKLLYKQQGSEGYTAPEVLKRSGYNCSADIYSLGCTLYFLMTGGRPLPSQERPWDHIPDPKTVEFLKKLTHEDPSKRPTAEEAMVDSWLQPWLLR